MARHEFRFAIDGFELNEDESAIVAAKIQAAGLSALGELGHRSALGVSVNGSTDGPLSEYLRWRGYWLMHEGLIDSVLPQLNKSGLLKQIDAGVGH